MLASVVVLLGMVDWLPAVRRIQKQDRALLLTRAVRRRMHSKGEGKHAGTAFKNSSSKSATSAKSIARPKRLLLGHVWFQIVDSPKNCCDYAADTYAKGVGMTIQRLAL